MKSETGARAGRPKQEDPGTLSKRAREIARRLSAAYGDARVMLDFKSPFELLIATILAAQCTDERVNAVTPALFRRFPGPSEMAGAGIEELESLVRSTGFFHNKAKSIKAASAALVEQFKSGFPETMEDMLRLPGVGRKTANVVLGVCFGQPAIIVDTHVRRVAQRLALATTDEPDAIETQLQEILPKGDWTRFSHSVTFHGRRCCAARKPDCPHCPVRELCPWPEKAAG